MNEKLISVIVPVYKAELYLSRCIDSMLAQTYSNFELILVDDGSPDKSGELCDTYVQKDARIKVIHKENGGASSSRNRGLDVMQGQYVVFLDSDDYVSQNYLENLYKSAIEYSCDIVQCEYSVTSDDIAIQNVDYNSEHVCVISKSDALNKRKFKVSPWGAIYNTKVFDSNRFTEGIIYEDDDMYYRLVYCADKVALLSENLYYYFMSTNSVMRNTNVDKKTDFIQIYERRIKYFTERNEQELLLGSYARFCITLMLFLSSARVHKHNLKDISTLWSYYKKYYKLFGNSKCVPITDRVLLASYRIFPKTIGFLLCHLRHE